jgi:hypothetical protein
MLSFISAEPFAFSLAIVACHFALAFFGPQSQNDSGFPTPVLGSSQGHSTLAGATACGEIASVDLGELNPPALTQPACAGGNRPLRPTAQRASRSGCINLAFWPFVFLYI